MQIGHFEFCSASVKVEAGNTSFDARRLHSSGMRHKGNCFLFLLELQKFNSASLSLKFNSAALSLLHGLPMGKDQRWPQELQGLYRNAAPTEGRAQQRHTQSGERVRECTAMDLTTDTLCMFDCHCHFSVITDKQFSNEDVFHTRLFPSDFGFIWCFTYDPPDSSPSGGEGQVNKKFN